MFFGYYGFPTPFETEPPPGRKGWMFLSNDHVVEVDLDTGATTDIGAIWNGGGAYLFADAVVWRPRFFGNTPGQQGGVLFGSVAGMYAWDGVTLSSPGDPAPDWLTSANEQPVVSTTMPVGLPGILALEVYQSRVWVIGETVISFSAASNGCDFSVAGGGGSFGYAGNILTTTYRDLRSSAGYLYVFGDSSTDMISNVITFGNPPDVQFTTQFNYVNQDPMVGQAFPRKVGHYGRYSILATGARPSTPTSSNNNSGNGIWAMVGNDAIEIGMKITNLWVTLDSSKFYPTFATVTMFGKRIVLVNGMFTDPWGEKRSMMLGWDGASNTWTVMSQNATLTNIGYIEQDSICDAYGTDGTTLWHLFDHPDTTLQKRLSTKFLKNRGPLTHLSINSWKRMFVEMSDKSDARGVSLTGTITTFGGGVPNGVEDLSFQLSPGEPYAFEAQPLSGQGIMAGIDLVSLSSDFIIERIHLSAEARSLYGA
jgi:hypothetical protein